MKKTKVMLAVAGLMINASLPALADLYLLTGPDSTNLYTSGIIAPNSGLGQVIPDNSPVGVGYGFDLTDAGVSVGDLSLRIDMAGGFNGDMYGYLQHYGVLVELFNPGAFSVDGAAGSTINITLASGLQSELNTATAADLASGSITFAAVGNLNSFVGLDAGGLWTLYFADQSAGDQMTLNRFSLSIVAVPEPQTWVLLGGGLVTLILLRRRTSL